LLFRNGGALTKRGEDLSAEERFPKLKRIYNAWHKAGLELATTGKISERTQRKCNGDFVPVPFFTTLKKFKFVRKIMGKKANDFKEHISESCKDVFE